MLVSLCVGKREKGERESVYVVGRRSSTCRKVVLYVA